MPLLRNRFGAIPLLILFVFAACGSRQPAADRTDRVPVVASILPLADFARQVGGDHVRVESLVPAGASPHTYNLSPAQLKAVSTAKLLILNGIGLEFWAGNVISAAGNPTLHVVTVSEGMKILAGDADDPGGNPHTWLSPRNAMTQVEKIRDALILVDPERATAYRANTETFLGELRNLDAEIREAVAGFSSRQIISFHAAWSYFAADYGLQEAAVIESRPGQSPSPAEIVAIVKKAREIKARAIFAELQFSPKAAEAIAAECDARVLFLNPLGDPPDYRYVDLMRANLRQIALALR